MTRDNHYKRWTTEDLLILEVMIDQGRSVESIATQLKRSTNAVINKSCRINKKVKKIPFSKWEAFAVCCIITAALGWLIGIFF